LQILHAGFRLEVVQHEQPIFAGVAGHDGIVERNEKGLYSPSTMP
jgi:hypothetical protein